MLNDFLSTYIADKGDIDEIMIKVASLFDQKPVYGYIIEARALVQKTVQGFHESEKEYLNSLQILDATKVFTIHLTYSLLRTWT